MKDKLRKLAEDYTVSTKTGQALYNELSVLFNVSQRSEPLICESCGNEFKPIDKFNYHCQDCQPCKPLANV